MKRGGSCLEKRGGRRRVTDPPFPSSTATTTAAAAAAAAGPFPRFPPFLRALKVVYRSSLHHRRALYILQMTQRIITAARYRMPRRTQPHPLLPLLPRRSFQDCQEGVLPEAS